MYPLKDIDLSEPGLTVVIQPQASLDQKVDFLVTRMEQLFAKVQEIEKKLEEHTPPLTYTPFGNIQ